jgi:hypothetical protein
MKISELQEGRGYLEEGPAWDAVKKAGTAVGQGLGAAAQAVGSVPGAAVGAGKAFMKGYRGARDTVAGGPTNTPAAPAAAGTPAPTAPAPTAPAPTAPAPTAPAATAPAPTAPAAGTPPSTAPTAPAAGTPPAAPAPKKPGFMDKVKGMISGKPAAPATAPVEPTLGAPAAPKGPDAAAQARIAAAPHGYDPETGKPNPAPGAPATDAAPAPGAPAAPAPTKNAAGTDSYENVKGQMRKITPVAGAKPLPAEMAARLDGDMAKLAKGDKDSGVFAADKILKFANAGYDVSALQPKWMASSKAGERFLTQSVYREISKMLKEHGLTWANLGLRIRLNESIKGHGVFLSKRIATPIMPSASKIEESLKAKFKGI